RQTSRVRAERHGRRAPCNRDECDVGAGVACSAQRDGQRAWLGCGAPVERGPRRQDAAAAPVMARGRSAARRVRPRRSPHGAAHEQRPDGQGHPIGSAGGERRGVGRERVADRRGRAGLTVEVACPVTVGGTVSGLLVLFGRGRPDIDGEVMTMLTMAGSEIGQFIHRSETTVALQRSEADHRAIFERAPIGIARISAEGELLEGNAALLMMLKHDIDTLRTQAWPELRRAYDLAAGRVNLPPLLAGISDGGSVQVRAATGDGRWLWLPMSPAAIPDLNGRPEARPPSAQ